MYARFLHENRQASNNATNVPVYITFLVHQTLLFNKNSFQPSFYVRIHLLRFTTANRRNFSRPYRNLDIISGIIRYQGCKLSDLNVSPQERYFGSLKLKIRANDFKHSIKEDNSILI